MFRGNWWKVLKRATLTGVCNFTTLNSHEKKAPSRLSNQKNPFWRGGLYWVRMEASENLFWAVQGSCSLKHERIVQVPVWGGNWKGKFVIATFQWGGNLPLSKESSCLVSSSSNEAWCCCSWWKSRRKPTLYRMTPGLRGGFHSSITDLGFCVRTLKSCTISGLTVNQTTHEHVDGFLSAHGHCSPATCWSVQSKTPTRGPPSPSKTVLCVSTTKATKERPLLAPF